MITKGTSRQTPFSASHIDMNFREIMHWRRKMTVEPTNANPRTESIMPDRVPSHDF